MTRKRKLPKAVTHLTHYWWIVKNAKRTENQYLFPKYPHRRRGNIFYESLQFFPYMIDGLNANCFDFSQFTFFLVLFTEWKTLCHFAVCRKKEEKKSFKNYTVIIRKEKSKWTNKQTEDPSISNMNIDGMIYSRTVVL